MSTTAKPRAAKALKNTPCSWRPPQHMRAKLSEMIDLSGVRFSELVEMAVVTALEKAKTPEGLIDMKLRYRRSLNARRNAA